MARKAQEEGVSIYKLIKRILAQALGLSPQPEESRKAEFIQGFRA